MSKKSSCSNSTCGDTWAVSLCFASATIMSLEALHPGTCGFMQMSPEKCFTVCATIASLSTFLGTFILMRALGKMVGGK